MSFLFTKSKKELDIKDALLRKEAKITIGGKPVVIKAFKLAQALQLIEALKPTAEVLTLATTDIAAFNRYLLAKMPEILAFCLPNYKIEPESVTLTEFADLMLAIYCVNDLERIITNFSVAVQSIQKVMPASATSPKQ